MIKVELGEEVDGPGKNTGRRHGKFYWRCERFGVEGFSRQPLLDACREIKRMGGNPKSVVGLFRKGKTDPEGRPVPDMTCTVGDGARLTVSEPSEGRIRFVKWIPYPKAELCEKTATKIDEFSRAKFEKQEP